MSSIVSGPVALFHDALRTVDRQLENVSLAADALQRGRAPLPPITSDFNEAERQSFISKTIGAIRDQVQRGLPIASLPPDTLRALLDAFAASKKWEEGIDDRKLFLDYVFVFLSRAPPSEQTKELEHGAIKLLYRDLPHPPSTHMGPNFQFRSFDGSGNSSTVPEMGRSFTPYSRSCASTRTLPVDDLPDAGLVFDMLIRRDKFIPHPAGLSGLFFNWATTVIHSVFRTRRTNWNINETSSYVDLGILYGNTKYHTDRLRVVDGQGKIIPDSFAEIRISQLPPGVAAIIIMFNRNHNWIAEHLLQINERKSWKDPSLFTSDDKTKHIYTQEPDYKTQLEKQDYEIFQTARLINSLTYANVVLSDFLGGILGTQRDGSTWTLDISSERREDDHTLLERGQGNSCSVEFNVLYRLHPSMSESDEAYIEQTFKAIFGNDVQWDELTPEIFEFKVSDFVRMNAERGLGKTDVKPTSIEAYRKKSEFERNQEKDDSQPTDYLHTTRVAGAKRDDTTGRFNDADLAKVLHDATQVPAAAFKARGVPNVMRVIEILGIQQARNWGCCTINEFRRFLGLRPYATFEEWNPDPVIADAARKLYRNTENLELYIGLVAEQPKPVGNGAGLCPSFTMARAILADAVALVRGDRYLTYDATPYNLTAWGITEGSRDTKNAAFAGTLGRLFQRGLPQYFPAESVYLHFPLVTPTGQPLSMDNVLRDLGKYEDYTYDRPTKSGDTEIVSIPEDVSKILSDPSNGLITPYGRQIKEVGLDKSFLSAIDEPAKYDKVVKFIQELFLPGDELKKTLLWFHDRTLELIHEKNLPIINVRTKAHAIDVVKDVFRLVPVHWASTLVAGLPLKTSFQPHGIYYEQQVYQMLSEIHAYIYTEVDPNRKIPYRHEAHGNVERLGRFVKLALLEAMGGVPASVLGNVSDLFLGEERNTHNPILRRIAALKSPLDESANDIIGVISTAAIELSQIFSHVVNFYLAPTKPGVLDPDFDSKDHEYNKKLAVQAKLVIIATRPGPDGPDLLAGYVREALRLDPVVDGVYRQATHARVYEHVSYKKGDKVFFDYRAVGVNAKTFEKPQEIDPHRPVHLYKVLQGDGVFKVLGQDFVYGAAANVLRAVFSLKDVRRANGPAGTLRRFKENFIAPVDELTKKDVDAPLIILGDDGKPVKLTESKTIKIRKYGWKSTKITDPAHGKVNTTWKYKYSNPEDEHRLTLWATGLTLNYDE